MARLRFKSIVGGPTDAVYIQDAMYIEIGAAMALSAAMDVVTPGRAAAETAGLSARPSNSAVRPAPEISVIVPIFNAHANVPILVERLGRVLASCDWEVI